MTFLRERGCATARAFGVACVSHLRRSTSTPYVFPVLTGRANSAAPAGLSWCGREGLWWRFALENAGGVGFFGKAAAEPPHSTMGWARFRSWSFAIGGGAGGARIAPAVMDGGNAVIAELGADFGLLVA